MKILFVIKNYYPYDDGSSNCVKCIEEELSNLGEDVHILSMKYDFNVLDEENCLNIKIHRILDKYVKGDIIIYNKKVEIKINNIHTLTLYKIVL